MPTLKLWIAEQHDHPAYNITGRPRKEVIEKIKDEKLEQEYKTIYRCEIEYTDALDLFNTVTGEGGGRRPTCYTYKEYQINL